MLQRCCWFLLYSNVNQLHAGTHLLPLGLPPPRPAPAPQVIRELQAGPLCPAAALLRVRLLCTQRCAHISPALSSSHPLPPLLCPQVCTLCLCFYFCPANRFIGTIFLGSIYMHSYMTLALLFLAYPPFCSL